MSGNDYLAEYDRTLSADLSAGMSGRLRARLDAMARAQGQRDRHALFLPRALDVAGMSVGKSLTVMEIGCGSGWAMSFRHPNVRYVAVDLGSHYRPLLESQGMEFHETDVSRSPLPCADASVDFVMLNHLIEHIANGEYLVREVGRVLAPGGRVYIRTPNVTRVKWRFFNDYTHVRPFTVEGLRHLMSACGFDPHVVLHSDHARINLDILTKARFRPVLFSRRLGGAEIEAVYMKRA